MLTIWCVIVNIGLTKLNDSGITVDYGCTRKVSNVGEDEEKQLGS